MSPLLRLSQLIDATNERIGRFAYWLIPLMVLVGVWNVIGRYVGRAIGQNLSSNALIEIQWYLFALIFLLGAAYTLKHNAHVRMDALYSNWRSRQKAIADLVGTLLFLIPFTLMTLWFATKPILNSWKILEASPDPGGLPRYPIKTIVAIGLALLLFQGISEAIKKWAIVNGSRSQLEEIENVD